LNLKTAFAADLRKSTLNLKDKTISITFTQKVKCLSLSFWDFSF